jgi:hypothetical protein
MGPTRLIGPTWHWCHTLLGKFFKSTHKTKKLIHLPVTRLGLIQTPHQIAINAFSGSLNCFSHFCDTKKTYVGMHSLNRL